MIEPIGAAGDGVTDDTAALQAALDQGGHIYVPGGTYLVANTPLRLVARTRLELAPDAVIVRGSSPGLIRNRHPTDDFGGYSGRGQILIEGGTWDMAGAGTGDVALPASAMTFAHGDNIKVRDTIIRDVPGAHGIDCIGNRNVRITDVTFTGYRADPADTQPRESIQIDGTYGSYSGDALPADKTPCDDVLIRGCRFQASDLLPAPQRAVGSHGYTADVTGYEHRNIRVFDCAIEGVTEDGIWAWKWSRSQIARNHITSPAKNGIVLREGTWDVEVEYNQVYDAGYSGIWANDGCHNLGVRFNRLVGSSAAANNTHYGIRFSGGCVTSEIVGNRVRRRGSGNEARYGLSITSGQQRIVRYGNFLTWSGITGSLEDLSTAPATSGGDVL